MVDMWNHMFMRYGRNSIEDYRIEDQRSRGPIKRDKAAGIALYLTKYVAKASYNDNTWWDFDGYMGGKAVDASRIAGILGLEHFSSD